MTRPSSNKWLVVAIATGIGAIALSVSGNHAKAGSTEASNAVELKAPAGNLPTSQHTLVDGYDAAVLPTGRLVTPAGKEIDVGAPKPYGMDLSPDGKAGYNYQ